MNVIQYITITSAGNASDFGDLTAVRSNLAATSNLTGNRGVFGGGLDSESSPSNIIDYVSINSTGNASDFGDLDQTLTDLSATSNANINRGVFAGGNVGRGATHNIVYITITSMGNASAFGELTTGRDGLTATSNI